MRGWALMYHRVVPRRPDTAPYFERGTAVEPDVFAAQLDWLAARHASCRPTDRAFDGVVLTFDDGYRDVIDTVWPSCRARGLRCAVYPVADHLAENATALWFDDYYDRVVRSRWHAPAAARRALDAVELDPRDAPPTPSLRWWVRGPVKAALSAAGPRRAHMLEEIGHALDTPRDPRLCRRLYLDRPSLRTLRAQGVEIGGHGHDHHRHASLPTALLSRELAGAAALLDDLGVGAPRSYCYPDGSLDDEAVEAVGRRFARAFTVEPGPLTPTGTDPLRLPRYLVRNRAPDDPDWCAAMHDTGFARSP